MLKKIRTKRNLAGRAQWWILINIVILMLAGPVMSKILLPGLISLLPGVDTLTNFISQASGYLPEDLQRALSGVGNGVEWLFIIVVQSFVIANIPMGLLRKMLNLLSPGSLNLGSLALGIGNPIGLLATLVIMSLWILINFLSPICVIDDLATWSQNLGVLLGILIEQSSI